MEYHQRKLTLYDIYGNAIVHKYCIFRKETPENVVNSQHSKLPALYLHNFVWQHSPDGPASHTHPGTTTSIILKGGYKELYRNKIIDRKFGSINIVSYNETHKIVEAIPGTWTIFFRWFTKTDNIKIVPETCKDICVYCNDNFGKCFNENKTFNFDVYSKQFDTSNNTRFSDWHIAGPDTSKKMARRRKAVEKLTLKVPTTPQEQLITGRKYSKLPLLKDPEKLTNEELIDTPK